MLSGGFKLLTKDDHLLIKEDVTFFSSCKAVCSSAIALPYMEGILEERWEGERGGGERSGEMELR